MNPQRIRLNSASAAGRGATVPRREVAASVDTVHPIERLRAVARAGWAGPDMLAAEAAWALADLAVSDPVALVPACRRLLERHPGCGPLWWVAARVLTAGDPVAEAEQCGIELEEDPTDGLVQALLPPGARVVRHGGVGEVAAADLVLVPVDAVGTTGMVVDPDDRGLLLAARQVEVPIWIEAGVGRVLPPRLWAVMAERLERPPRDGPGIDAAGPAFGMSRRVVLESLGGVARVVGPGGGDEPAVALAGADCPEPAELLARW